MGNTISIDECVSYFKRNKGFQRAFEAMRKKYLSLGAIKGTIVIAKLTDQEKSILSGLLRRDFSGKSSASIKLAEFQKALEWTKFKDFSLEDILKKYFEDELISNSQQQSAYLRKRDAYFNTLIKTFEQTPSGKWLEKALAGKKFGYNTLIQRYDNDLQRLGPDLNFICTALNNLPVFEKSTQRLPVFASKITSNPHAFDADESCGQLFLYALVAYFDTNKPETRLEYSELLYKAGILIDEVSNSVLSSGLEGFGQNGLHPGWEGFLINNEAFLATLTNVSKLTKVDSPYKAVFVVENPSVFMSIRDNFSNNAGFSVSGGSGEGVNVPMICGYGQINMATLVLMDLLTDNGVTIYYSGDFDPEGLLIADKLKKRYGYKLKLWRYSLTDYEKCISLRAVSQIRLKQLNNILDAELKQISGAIYEKGLCGYQEQLINDLINDIVGLLNV